MVQGSPREMPFRDTFSQFGESDDDASDGAMRPVPVLGKDVRLDDDNATLIMVFGILKDEDGSSDDSDPLANAVVENPQEQAAKIFIQEVQDGSRKTTFDSGTTTSASEFHRSVRQHLARVIKAANFRLETFRSIDRDEVFWKIHASEEVLQKLASRFGYRLPFMEEAYGEDGPPQYESKTIFAYHAYNDTLRSQNQLQAFREVDAVRLVDEYLRTHVDITELFNQNVLVPNGYFPAARYKEVLRLHKHWVKSKEMPNLDEYDRVRDYFGEEIAFFFSFMGFYIWRLGALCIVAVPVCFAELPVFGLHPQLQNRIKIILGILIVFWCFVFETGFSSEVRAAAVRWGTFEHKVSEMDMPNYEGRKSPGWDRWCINRLGDLLTLVFVCIFIITIGFVCFITTEKYLRSLFQTGLTFLFSFVWGYIARWIVNAENHRTKQVFNDALTLRLAIGKLFFFLWPLCRIAFLERFIDRKCAGSLEDALKMLMPEDEFWQQFPQLAAGEHRDHNHYLQWGQRQAIAADSPPGVMLKFFQGLDFNSTVCVQGCKPRNCAILEGDMVSCLEQDYYALQISLWQLFFIHVICTVVFIIVPIIKVRRAALQEITDAENLSDEEKDNEYTFLQFQGKCKDGAVYDYLEWGGSFVEDMVEVLMSFAVIASFAIITPALVPLAFVAQLLEYKLLALRMTHITCRPFPSGSQGIGASARVLDLIIYVAIVINVLLVFQHMRTFMNLLQWHVRAIILLAAVIVMQGIWKLLQVLSPPERSDLRWVINYNDDFQRVRKRYTPGDLQKVKIDDVDTGVS